MDVIFYALGSALILTYLFDMRVAEPARCMSFGLVRILLALPLLAGAYLYFASDMPLQPVTPHLFIENVFSLTWIFMAYRLQPGRDPDSSKSHLYRMFILIGGILVLGGGFYGLLHPPAVEIVADLLVFPRFGHVYISSFFMLLAAFLMAWQLEMYWRSLDPKDRWQVKYLVVGFFLISGSFFWCASYRLLYRRLVGDHNLLLAILLMIAWSLILYAVIHHRLLNRKLFVSRRVIYSAVAPIIFAGYLILLGLASLLMRAIGWSLPYVFQWLLIVSGLLFVIVLVFSGKVRSSVRYFISTHFYVNKYEYRDEWLAFSTLLRESLTERDVVEALRRILSKSLYTRQIMVWLGDIQDGFRLIDGDKDHGRSADEVILSDDPLILYLQNEPYFYLEMPGKTQAWRHVHSKRRDFFLKSGLVLAVPLTVGRQCVGLIGLGPEYTGGLYGRDDFDLLTALGSQAALAILAAHAAEKQAQARETSAWNTLSSFVLHDIKNAAMLLNLVKENVPAHIHQPEFQQDLLVSVDDALKRMNKVQERLKALKGGMKPSIKAVEIGQFVCACCEKLARKLQDLAIDVQCQQNFNLKTDPEIIVQIIENLMLNALEAGGPGTLVLVKVSNAGHQFVQLEIEDSGPGIPAELLPGRLFEPFKTTKRNGSGIGLWQAKRLIESLGGTIEAGNVEGSGARFVVRLPVDGASSI
jgi:putative PEP-CTERM system histidine kinase